jgi:hypothetical protein
LARLADWNSPDFAAFFVQQNGGRESTMAIPRQQQAVREKLVGYVFLAGLAAVIAFILYNHIVMF